VAKLDRALDRLLFGVAKRSSGRGIAGIAIFLYGGLGLALPVALQWPVLGLVAMNFAATTWAGLVILVWLGVQAEAANRRHLLEWTSDLRRLDSEEFEWLVGEVFRREGWKVDERGRREGPDGNIDLAVNRNGVRRIVQCKRWQSWLVGVEDVRAFSGTLMREGLPGSSGVFVTLSDFTTQARAEAKSIGLELVDNRDLYARVEKVRRKEPCPLCKDPMVLDRSSRGWWFRCTAPGCAGKRDLGADAARAIELLTDAN
jgi:hypothetical protein